MGKYDSYEEWLRSKDSLWRFGMKAAIVKALKEGRFRLVSSGVYELNGVTKDFNPLLDPPNVNGVDDLEAYINMRYDKAARKNGVEPGIWEDPFYLVTGHGDVERFDNEDDD